MTCILFLLLTIFDVQESDVNTFVLFTKGINKQISGIAISNTLLMFM